jgi:hypothetical protein
VSCRCSTAVVIDQNANVVDRRVFDPFGKVHDRRVQVAANLDMPYPPQEEIGEQFVDPLLELIDGPRTAGERLKRLRKERDRLLRSIVRGDATAIGSIAMKPESLRDPRALILRKLAMTFW